MLAAGHALYFPSYDLTEEAVPRESRQYESQRSDAVCCIREIFPQITLPQFQGSLLAGGQQNYSQALKHGMKGTEKVGEREEAMSPGTRDISSVTCLG